MKKELAGVIYNEVLDYQEYLVEKKQTPNDLFVVALGNLVIYQDKILYAQSFSEMELTLILEDLGEIGFAYELIGTKGQYQKDDETYMQDKIVGIVYLDDGIDHDIGFTDLYVIGNKALLVLNDEINNLNLKKWQECAK